MSTEFIIGTIIGVIGIIPIIIQVVKWVKKPKLSELMIRLADNGLSTKAHKNILRKMNIILLRSGKHISSEYINSFVCVSVARRRYLLTCACKMTGSQPRNCVRCL